MIIRNESVSTAIWKDLQHRGCKRLKEKRRKPPAINKDYA